MVFGKLKRRRKKKKTKEDKQDIEVIDFETNSTVKLEDYEKGVKPTKAYKEYSVLSRLIDHFSNPKNDKAEITRQEFALLVGEVIYTNKKKGVANGKSDSTRPVQSDSKK